MSEIVFPPAFVQRMQQQLGEDWGKFRNAHLLPSPTSIRINQRKRSEISQLGNDSVISEKIAWTDFGYYLNKRPSFTFDPLFHAGTYYVQEASSMFLEQALKQSVDLSQSLRVLDLCAAPGGKSTHLLSLINQSSLVVTNETIRTRATILAENICKWGNINVVVTNNDPEDFQHLNGFFDVIVVDAPCSGEGLFRKDKDAMNEWSEENAALCSSRQQRIVNQIWPALRQNGILIYSTCTYNKKENEENLIPFIESGKAESVKLNIETEWGIEEVKNQGVIGYQCFPNKVKGEGFFLSVLKKLEPEEELNPRTKKLFEFTSKKIVQQLSSWVEDTSTIEFISQDELILALPKENIGEIEFLSKKLKVIQKGTAVATMKHDKLIPEHAFALSNEINSENFPSLELTYDNAIAYLRKDVLNLSSEKTGFTLLKHQNVPLGWINQLGNRSNNLYPSNWRIRT
jgi:16S rRNA C967 or C1407 C5-methylase (RsmB/RsmF family)/NOL1/NOP2/fmu family ribosome biogenesis protein